MTAKEYLQQVRRKDMTIKNFKNDIILLKESMSTISGLTYGERVQSSRNNDKFGTLYSRIDEKEREIVDKIMECIDFKLKVSEEISALENSRYIEILHRRYLEFLTWGEIAQKMGSCDSSGNDLSVSLVWGMI